MNSSLFFGFLWGVKAFKKDTNKRFMNIVGCRVCRHSVVSQYIGKRPVEIYKLLRKSAKVAVRSCNLISKIVVISNPRGKFFLCDGVQTSRPLKYYFYSLPVFGKCVAYDSVVYVFIEIVKSKCQQCAKLVMNCFGLFLRDVSLQSKINHRPKRGNVPAKIFDLSSNKLHRLGCDEAALSSAFVDLPLDRHPRNYRGRKGGKRPEKLGVVFHISHGPDTCNPGNEACQEKAKQTKSEIEPCVFHGQRPSTSSRLAGVAA